MRKASRRTHIRGSDGINLGSRDWGSYLFLSIMAAAFLMGGSARHDVASLLLLRPLSLVLCGGALYLALRRGVLWGSMPLWFLVALISLVILQLVPLPQAVWQTFPGRELIAEAQILMGLGDTVWRPLTLAPARTFNTLFSLAVPLAVLLSLGLLGTAPQSHWDWKQVPLLLLALGLLAVVWGALQLIGPGQGPLYTYRITNPDVPVGPFANRNHQAIFLGSLIPLIGWQFLFGRHRKTLAIKDIALAALAMIVVLVTVLLTGSRAGSAVTLGAAAVVMAMLGIGNFGSKGERHAINAPRAAAATRFAAPLVAAAIASAIVIAWLYTDAEFFNRMGSTDPFADGRVQALPHIWRLLVSFFPVGSGFGSFEFVYKVIEPAELLNRRYLNQAHNDLLQFVLEGGLPGLLILAAFALWFLRCATGLLRSGWSTRFGQRTPPEVSLGIAASLAVIVLTLGSIVDYPLRTPLGMAYFAALCGLVAAASREKQARDRRQHTDPL